MTGDLPAAPHEPGPPPGRGPGRDPAPASPTSLARRVLRPTLPELWLFLAIALPVLAALIATLPTVDLAYQLRAGAEMLDGRGIPAVDTWTFTAAGRAWTDQQWLAQQFLALVYQAGGWTGLAILRAVLVGAIQGFLLVAILRTAPSLRPRTAALLALGAFIVMAPALALRPQLFGMVLFAGTLGVLAGRRERPGWWWIVPVLAAVWANYHGSFILAPLLVGLAWLEDLRSGWPGSRRTLATLLATVLATFATPFGPGVWAYAIGLARNPAVSGRISEWQPPSVTDVPGALFWISVVVAAVALVALARRGRAIAWPALLGLAVFAALAAIAARGVAWWPAIAAMTLAPLLGPGDPAAQAPPRPARRSALNGAVAALLVVAAVAALPFWRPTDPDLHAPSGLLAQAPPGVTAALRDLATPADRVWNPQVWGSWFEFAVPEPAYAFDSRVEIFPAEAWAAGDQVAAARGDWQGVLAAAGVTIVVAEGPESSTLARALAGEPSWRLVHADDLGTVWARASE